MGRFLVGNNHLNQLGGSETFTYAMVEELIRLGHEVDVICPTLKYPGTGSANAYPEIVRRLWGLGISVSVNAPAFSMSGRFVYDAALLSHNTTVEMLFRLFPDFPPAKVVQTIHGAFSPLEQPYLDKPIQYVTVSDELRERYPFARTIMNGVNLERFKPAEKIPGSVLSMCQSETFNTMLGEICAELGLSFKSRNKFVNPIWEIETELATAEIAIGIGRSAIEAMACGCAVMIADHRPYQGALTDGWMWLFDDDADEPPVTCNYSGRSFGQSATRDRMLDALSLHIGDENNPAIMDATREYAEQHHDIRKQVQRYLEVVGV